MKTLIEQENFLAELRGWAWRGLLCAGPSAAWAAMAGFTHPVEIVAMVLVVGGYIMAFAFGTAWLASHPTPVRETFSWALKVAGVVKATALLGAVGWWAISLGSLPKAVNWLVLLVWPDLLLGLGATELVRFVTPVREATEIGQQNSFVLTGLITLLQGAFLTVMLAVMALAILAGRSAWLRVKRRQPFLASG